MLWTTLLTPGAGLVSWLTLRKTLKPLVFDGELFADKVRGADLAETLPVARDDEIGMLVTGFTDCWIAWGQGSGAPAQ